MPKQPSAALNKTSSQRSTAQARKSRGATASRTTRAFGAARHTAASFDDIDAIYKQIPMPLPYVPLHDLDPPNLALLALEFRAFWEFGAVVPAWPALQRAPKCDADGDGTHVIVFPGLSAGDISTVPLRKYLDGLGYVTTGWGQGLNLGPRSGVLDAAQHQIRQVFETTGRKVSLVGWSLGGIYAREMAKLLPEMVHCVITLGTPFAGSPKSTNAWRIYELATGRNTDIEHTHYDLPMAPASVPTSSIYSRSDGIVAWQGSIQASCKVNPHTENIEVFASHVGIGLNPSAWWAVADRLAQKKASWKPFIAPKMMGLHKLVYPRSAHSAKREAA
jgi:pimeloyl-ACP methyl ester carboxylesterase